MTPLTQITPLTMPPDIYAPLVRITRSVSLLQP